MKRAITAELKRWKVRRNRKPLLVTGVRQCGKTYILKEFGNQEFSDCVYLNFDGNKGLQSTSEMKR